MRALLRLLFPALLVFALVAAPGGAQEGPEPVADEGVPEEEDVDDEVRYEEVTLYFHGTEPLGELDAASLEHMSMDDGEPSDSDSKSMGVTNAIVTPNTQCSGSPLFPTWDGFVEGTIEGDVTVTLHTLAHPASTVRVQLFVDAGSVACNEDYRPPVAEADVDLEPGLVETEVVFTDVEIPLRDMLTVMVHAVGPSQARVFYDSTEAPSRVEFTCRLLEDADTCLW